MSLRSRESGWWEKVRERGEGRREEKGGGPFSSEHISEFTSSDFSAVNYLSLVAYGSLLLRKDKTWQGDKNVHEFIPHK